MGYAYSDEVETGWPGTASHQKVTVRHFGSRRYRGIAIPIPEGLDVDVEDGFLRIAGEVEREDSFGVVLERFIRPLTITSYRLEGLTDKGDRVCCSGHWVIHQKASE